MAGIAFEGEIGSVTARQKEFIAGVLNKRRLKANKVRIETLGKAGDNYAANVKKITAELEGGETFKMVAKIAPTNEVLRATMAADITFANECLMYSKVLPRLVDLQRAAGLSKAELFPFPECYGVLMEPPSEIILLEDLKDSNFEMLDRFTPLTNESVKQIIKKFAILHSLSFVLKKKEPDTFETYAEKLIDLSSMMFGNPDFQKFGVNVENETISILDNDVYKKAVRGSLSQIWKHGIKIFKNQRNIRYSVITHGDGWTNNIMFRLKESIPVDAILIDYQMSKVGSPVCDLQYMIFICTDYKTRHQHFYEWIDLYHSELDKSLANFGLKVNYVYPRDQLDADLRRHSKFFFSSAILLCSVLIQKPENAAKMREAMENVAEAKDVAEALLHMTNLDSDSVQLYKRKIEDLVDSYRELGYLE